MCLTCHRPAESFSVPLSWAGRAGGREVTLLRRPRNNGLFFPGSLLHPHRRPPIGPRRLTIHRDRKLWQTRTTYSSNQGRLNQSDSFSKWLSMIKSVFSSFGIKRITSTHTHTQGYKESPWTMMTMLSWVSDPNGNLLYSAPQWHPDTTQHLAQINQISCKGALTIT